MSVTNTLSWTANTESDLKEYWVFRSTDGTTFSQLATVPKGTQTYVDTVTADATYFYYLKAVDTAGLISQPSLTVSKVVNTNPPQAPVGLSVV